MYDYFEKGPLIDVMSLPEDEALMILGRPLYEAIKDTRGIYVKGHLKVTSIDRQRSTITVTWEDSE